MTKMLLSKIWKNRKIQYLLSKKSSLKIIYFSNEYAKSFLKGSCQKSPKVPLIH